ncbi:unnamed protein product [Ranitomeya imitator]|uniref:Reverse transcriptase domain-containing protein n=1 Tax=Ranitomeya imitator TaxID=111125 RepID=A0ABN9MKP5_9NEOB|nr:unnamed protein product [Ranitomeya imitator]
MPPHGDTSNIDLFSLLVERDLKKLRQTDWRTEDNLTENERRALDGLKSNDLLIIKPSDKGGNLVIMDHPEYRAICVSILQDRTTYEILTTNPLESFKNELRSILEKALSNQLISRGEFDFMLPQFPLTATFYALPKVHKGYHPLKGRPIVSGVDSLTQNCGLYVDQVLCPFVTAMPSYLRDTSDLLLKLEGVNLGRDTWLTSIDIEALYSSIPHWAGIEGVRFFLQQRSIRCGEHNDFVITLLEYILTHNAFTFDGKHFHQLRGTAMGCPCAPSYANLFLGWWEETIVFGDEERWWHKFISIWYRYIDDVFMVWTGTREEFTMFMGCLNINKVGLKFTSEISEIELAFLDLKIVKDESGQVATSIYRKPTSTNSLLHWDSHHPVSLKRGIPKGQFLRLRRNCSREDTFKCQSGDMLNRFREKGYPRPVVSRAYDLARRTDRQGLLQKHRRTEVEDTVRVIGTFDTQHHEVRRAFTRHWDILKLDPDLIDVDYVGKTKREFRRRVGEHMGDIRHKRDTPLAKHMHTHHSDDPTGVRFTILEVVKVNPRGAVTVTADRGRGCGTEDSCPGEGAGCQDQFLGDRSTPLLKPEQCEMVVGWIVDNASSHLATTTTLSSTRSSLSSHECGQDIPHPDPISSHHAECPETTDPTLGLSEELLSFPFQDSEISAGQLEVGKDEIACRAAQSFDQPRSDEGDGGKMSQEVDDDETQLPESQEEEQGAHVEDEVVDDIVTDPTWQEDMHSEDSSTNGEGDSADNPKQAICSTCHARISRGSKTTSLTTTSMIRHMEAKHPTLWAEPQAPGPLPAGHTTASSTVLRRSQSQVHHACEDASSPAPVVAHSQAAPSASASTSLSQHSIQLSITQSLECKRKYPANAPQATVLNSNISPLLALEMLPFRLLETEAFRNLMAAAVPRYSVPSRLYFSRCAISALHQHVSHNISHALHNAVTGKVHLTMDTWTSACGQGRYISMTAHWVNIVEAGTQHILPKPSIAGPASIRVAPTVYSFCTSSSSSSMSEINTSV